MIKDYSENKEDFLEMKLIVLVKYGVERRSRKYERKG